MCSTLNPLILTPISRISIGISSESSFFACVKISSPSDQYLYNINQHAIVTHPYYYYLRVLQLHYILALLLIRLGLLHLLNLVLVALAERLAYCYPPNANSSVLVVQRVQLNFKPFIYFLLQRPRQLICFLQALLIRLYIVAKAAAKHLHSKILTEQLQVR